MVSSAEEAERLASEVESSGGVFFVPAFSGLFAPHWDSSARGILHGLTHNSNRRHIGQRKRNVTLTSRSPYQFKPGVAKKNTSNEKCFLISCIQCFFSNFCCKRYSEIIGEGSQWKGRQFHQIPEYLWEPILNISWSLR